MILKNDSVDGFADYVKNKNKKIILFGAGTLLNSWIAWLLNGHGLTDRVMLIADNDPNKWGGDIRLNGREFVIRNADHICRCAVSDTVILITSSYFAAMIEQLDEMCLPDEVKCYVAPVMHITDRREDGADIRGWMARKRQIPKVIHYCWFGGGPLSEKSRQCVESWRQYCPGYEIVEWNERNYDVGKNRYMEQAYKDGKYGYVPDYARIDILYHYGGLYFDTDVELVRSPDELLYLEAFTSFEEYPTVNFGGGSGCVKGFPLLKTILDFREDIDFIKPDGSVNRTTCGYYESVPLVEEGLRLDGTLQNVRGLTVFPSEYFHPHSTVTGQTQVTGRTYAIHRFGWSWMEAGRMEETLETHRKYEEILRRMQGAGKRSGG